jgi:hypothetical protein
MNTLPAIDEQSIANMMDEDDVISIKKVKRKNSQNRESLRN